MRSLSVWCQFVPDDWCNAVVCIQPTSLLIGNVWVPVILICMSYTLQRELESGQEARSVQVDVSAAFDRDQSVNHQEIL